MKKNLFLFGIALSLLVACKSTKNTTDAAASAADTETWIIADQKSPCAESSTENCFQVKKLGESSYSLMNLSIEGFTYEPNFKYQIIVKSKKGNYTLVKELYKVATN